MIQVERRSLKAFTHRKSFFAPLRLEASLSEIYHENTKLGRKTGRAYLGAIENFLRPREVRELLTRAYKTYTLMDRVDLPSTEPRNLLEETLVRRRSQREYQPEPVTLDELSRLLYFSYGKTDPTEGSFFRPVASGGGLYPLEVYVLALRVTDLDPGVYHYNVEDHGLEVVERRECSQIVREQLYTGGIDIGHAALVVVYTAIFRRSTAKYLDRGYRMILMEAGAAAHNLCLVATSQGLGTCQLGGFLDDELSRTLGIDGREEAPLLPVVVGKVPTADTGRG
jgi:SagB-type dehydrogenase family enzyme